MRPAMKRRITDAFGGERDPVRLGHEPPPEEAGDAHERAEEHEILHEAVDAAERRLRPEEREVERLGEPHAEERDRPQREHEERREDDDVEEPGPRSSGSTSRRWPIP